MTQLISVPAISRRRPRFVPYHIGWSLALINAWSACLAVETSQPAVTFQFVEVGASRGIGPYQMSQGLGGGVAAADFDDDGDVDLFVPNGAGVPDQLYRNLGSGQFEEIAGAAGLASVAKNRCALWFDYDGDADLDLLVANDDPTEASTFRLYRQHANALFEDVTAVAGLSTPLPPRGMEGFIPQRSGICAGDLNRDGYLDIFAPLWNGMGHMFMNNRDGTFTDVSVSSRTNAVARFAHQAVMADFDQDGWLDIYVTIDFGPNLLWINQGDGTFSDVAQSANCANSMNDMGMTLGDYDRDGDLDIYVTNIFSFSIGWNVLLRNDSIAASLNFSEVARSLGVEKGGWGWGTTFLDANNNGWLDLAATNQSPDSSKFFRNLGGDPPVFTNVSSDVQFNGTEYGSALISFDYDRDGDLDMLQTTMSGPLRLLENVPAGVGHSNGYLVVKPRIDGPNHYAIGTLVQIQMGSVTMMRLITAGTSYLGQEPAEAFFGVADATMVDTVTLLWPDGEQTILADVEINQILTVTHIAPIMIPAIPTVSKWGIMVMGLLIVAAGSIVMAKSRRLAGRRVKTEGG